MGSPSALCQCKRSLIARNELFFFSVLAVTITGTYGMDDILAGQMIAFCDFGRRCV